jgi:hypothetical protein
MGMPVLFRCPLCGFQAADLGLPRCSGRAGPEAAAPQAQSRAAGHRQSTRRRAVKDGHGGEG